MAKHQTVKSTMNDRFYDPANESMLLLICLPNVKRISMLKVKTQLQPDTDF